MFSFKNCKGVSIVSMIITVIVVAIIAGVSINFGLNGVNETRDAKATSELQMVQNAVLQQYAKYKTTRDSVYLVGNVMSDDEIQEIADEMDIELVDIPDTYSNKDYYRLDKASLTAIGIEDSSDEYIINYISGEVINITKRKTSSDVTLYIRGNSF